jgi:DNA-directed RNA polymerase specialized sigma24 family protein
MGVLGSDFDQFGRDSSPRLLRMAYLLTGDRGHAEDVVQTALLQVARKWRRIRGEPAPYAHRAVVNLAKNHRRDRSRRPHESTATIEPWYAPPEADALLQQELLPAVMDLPVRQRAVSCCATSRISRSSRPPTPWAAASEPSRARPTTP